MWPVHPQDPENEAAAVEKTYCNADLIAFSRTALPALARAVLAHEDAIVHAIVAGRKVVDECNESDGYDSMVFAEARRAWHDTIGPLRAFEDNMRLLRMADNICHPSAAAAPEAGKGETT